MGGPGFTELLIFLLLIVAGIVVLFLMVGKRRSGRRTSNGTTEMRGGSSTSVTSAERSTATNTSRSVGIYRRSSTRLRVAGTDSVIKPDPCAGKRARAESPVCRSLVCRTSIRGWVR